MANWFCIRCGAPNEGKFCTKCGSPAPERAGGATVRPDEPVMQAVEPNAVNAAAEQPDDASQRPAAQSAPEAQQNAAQSAPAQQYAYAQPSPARSAGSGKRLSGGAAVGIALGVIALAAIVVMLVLMGTPTGIELDMYDASMEVGDELKVTATVTRFLAKPTVDDVEWSSSDTRIAGVYGGNVEAVEEGSAVITATAGKKTAACSVSAVWPTVRLGSSDYKINIRELDLSGADVTDLSPLKAMFQLESLNLTNTPVSDVSHLAAIKTLKSVTLTGTNVTDVADIVNRMDITIAGLECPLTLGFGEAYPAGEADFGLVTGGAAINWTSDNTKLLSVNGSTLTATGTQDDIVSFDGSCTVTGRVAGTNIKLIYNAEVAPDAKSYYTYWPEDSETVTTSSYRATVYPLYLEPAVEQACGFTFEYVIYKGDSGDAAKRDFAVRVRTTGGSWKKVGTIPVEYGVWKTATILFDEPMSFTRLVILPNTVCRWDDNYAITGLIFAPPSGAEAD